jgi:anti-sigma regulatory factor (Ser/Thr protein kinase)
MRRARRFPCKPESVAGARHFVRDALSAQPREIVEAAELMTSEVATNSVRHAQTDFELAILLSRREIRVEVSDHGQGQPVPRSPRTLEQSGRGLQIVLALSDAWGVTPSHDGKLVWFSLQLRAPAGEHSSQSTASIGKVPEQRHELEHGQEADLGSSHPPTAERCCPDRGTRSRLAWCISRRHDRRCAAARAGRRQEFADAPRRRPSAEADRSAESHRL